MENVDAAGKVKAEVGRGTCVVQMDESGGGGGGKEHEVRIDLSRAVKGRKEGSGSGWVLFSAQVMSSDE